MCQEEKPFSHTAYAQVLCLSTLERNTFKASLALGKIVDTHENGSFTHLFSQRESLPLRRMAHPSRTNIKIDFLKCVYFLVKLYLGAVLGVQQNQREGTEIFHMPSVPHMHSLPHYHHQRDTIVKLMNLQ